MRAGSGLQVQSESNNCPFVLTPYQIWKLNFSPDDKSTTSKAMAQGKPIPEDVQWIIIRLGTVMTPEDISMYTNVNERTIRKILKFFKETEGIYVRDRSNEVRLNRSLNNCDIEVCDISVILTWQ
jgi:hypothetical protein